MSAFVQTFLRWIVLLSTLLFATHLHAQSSQASYSFTIRGLQVGNLQFEHSLTDSAYSVDTNFKTTGLAGALFNATLTAKTTGTGIKNGAYQPQNASIEFIQSDEKFSQEMTYNNGELANVVTDPRIRTTLDPVKQTGAVDPLTALAYILRPVPLERLCKMNVRIFDGITATRITLSQASQRPDGRFQCQGGYAREHGFSAEQLASEGENFYFTTLYRVDRRTGDMIIDRIVGESAYGQFQLLRN